MSVLFSKHALKSFVTETVMEMQHSGQINQSGYLLFHQCLITTEIIIFSPADIHHQKVYLPLYFHPYLDFSWIFSLIYFSFLLLPFVLLFSLKKIK